jgi:hypothetical protein
VVWGIEDILFVISQWAMGARGSLSNQLAGKVTMVIASQKDRAKRRSVLEKIKVEGKVDEGREVILRRATATVKCEGFKSLMVLWAKVYPVRKPRHLWRG